MQKVKKIKDIKMSYQAQESMKDTAYLATQGDATALLNLAIHHVFNKNNPSAPKDLLQAYIFFLLSDQQGGTSCASHITLLERHVVPPKTKLEIRHIAQLWVPGNPLPSMKTLNPYLGKRPIESSNSEYPQDTMTNREIDQMFKKSGANTTRSAEKTIPMDTPAIRKRLDDAVQAMEKLSRALAK